MDADVIYGFKRITLDNLLKGDITAAFAGPTEGEWISLLARPQLADSTPEEVRRLFELARGTMIYGWFYYPLLTLGYAECTRVLEAAARHAARMVGLEPTGKEKSLRYREIVDKLHMKGLIAPDQLARWHLGREVRNIFAHPAAPTILTPGLASDALREAANDINTLFSRMTRSLDTDD